MAEMSMIFLVFADAIKKGKALIFVHAPRPSREETKRISSNF